MIRNYFKIAIRSLLRHKTFSFINIFGLAISMSICIVIIMMVADQMSYDRHITNSDRVYRINHERMNDDDLVNKMATTPLPLADALMEEYAGVENTVRIRRGFGNNWIDIENDINIPLGGFFAEPSFLDIFEYNLEHGNASTALAEPNSVILTKAAAEKLFDIDNPTGELIDMGELGEYKVTGVLEKSKGKSHIKFEALASYSSLNALEADSTVRIANDSWRNSTAGWVYIRLAEGKSVADIENGLQEIGKREYAEMEDINYRFYLQNITKITPGPLIGNQIGPGLPDIFIYFLAGLALIIMLSACFNYTNLSIARALTRAKEIGIRKVSGAYKHQIFTQFLSEAIILALLALVFALGLLVILKPAFMNMQFAQLLQWDLNSDPMVYVVCILFSVVVGLMAGFFPALMLSSFQPIKVLKDLSGVKLFSKLGLRKSLLVIQFVLSLIFIISATLVHNQLKMMVTADYGFNGENTMNVKLNNTDYKTLKNELSKFSSITNISASSHVPAAGTSYGNDIKINPEDEAIAFNYFAVDEDYIDNMELNLVAGSNFRPQDIKDEDDKLIVNETMVEKLNFSSILDAIGQPVLVDDSLKYTIIGVVEDYNHQAMMMAIGPMALMPSQEQFNMLQVKMNPDNHDLAIENIKQTWAGINPSKKVHHRYFEEEVQEFYDLIFSDLVDIVGFISFLAITIACLGLLGMATFTTETKLKEVSIRKVLGATDKNVVLLLSKGFISLLALAIVIAIPAAYFLNSLWLEAIAYRVSINFGVISFSTLIMLVLGIVTIGSQTLRATLTNPVDTLRNE